MRDIIACILFMLIFLNVSYTIVSVFRLKSERRLVNAIANTIITVVLVPGVLVSLVINITVAFIEIFVNKCISTFKTMKNKDRVSK